MRRVCWIDDEVVECVRWMRKVWRFVGVWTEMSWMNGEVVVFTVGLSVGGGSLSPVEVEWFVKAVERGVWWVLTVVVLGWSGGGSQPEDGDVGGVSGVWKR
ncbi:unnamed protein product [Lathyrus oleraceus]